ncbi:MAG: NlpC/P60 family protein [Jatrophihabitans sp.]
MIRRVLLLLALLAGPAVVLSPSAQAAAGPVGQFSSVTQDSSTQSVTVRGYAYDARKSSASIGVRFYVGGQYAGRIAATEPSVTFDRSRAITGNHGFTATFGMRGKATSVTLGSVGIGKYLFRLDNRAVTQVAPTSAERIISVAKRYVGKARYRDGGASPSTGFDCSGYTQYVFAAAKVGALPHIADAQRRMQRMHWVSASSARAGDLVFYQSGGYSFHVAIYAGNHMQYAAATVRDGIRYQPIWSSNVVYGRYS